MEGTFTPLPTLLAYYRWGRPLASGSGVGNPLLVRASLIAAPEPPISAEMCCLLPAGFGYALGLLGMDRRIASGLTFTVGLVSLVFLGGGTEASASFSGICRRGRILLQQYGASSVIDR